MSTSGKTLDDDALSEVAVFPLPRLVLFPGTRLPLHFFEPRYRQMIEDTIEAGRSLIACAQLLPGWRQDYEGTPPIHTIAGLGRIVQHQSNADGTHDVLLEGIARAELHELPADGKPYRRARAVVIDDRVPPGGIPGGDLSALLSLASQVARHVQRNDPRFELLAGVQDHRQDPSRFIDRIADQLVPDPDTRQELLETFDVAKRLQRVSASVAQLQLALIASDRDDDDEGNGGGPRVLH